jgi:hypothetical protein
MAPSTNATAVSHRVEYPAVAVGALGTYTLSEGESVTLWNSNPLFFDGWVRGSATLAWDNSPGVAIAIADNASPAHRYGEAMSIDDDGNQNLLMTVINVGTGTAAINFWWAESGQNS